MTYYFSGVIAPSGGQEPLDDLVEKFGGVGRTLEDPFPAWVVAFGADWDDVSHLVHEPTTSKLLPWSRAFPAQFFIYIHVECWGGDCEQEGFAFKDGETIRVETWDDDRKDSSPLSRLLAATNIDFPPGIPFPPFSRDWFPPRTPLSDE